ncbi:hypothetical protein SLE2022_111020 [Rubroshorea leprosula]|uniref:Histidine-containing phosphotransfer protein n=1 Tax=Rubroshorea leprosula TaxID=152421 RepID=A0AAV5LAK3_9ROSI|nr:hypothetical protein SLEP1_g42660 [Rubroshorea leprosula]
MANNREALNNRLIALISSMEQEGMVDHRLAEARDLKEIISPFFFAELIPTFSSDAFNTLRELTAALAKTDLDFHQLAELCIKIRGSTSCIGACRMADACVRLSQAIDARSKEECMSAFEILKNEYLALYEKLDKIVELERMILSHETDD